MVMFKKKIECFNCAKRIKGGEEYTIKLETLEGPHEVKMCEPCAKEFDKIMIGLEEIINERNEPF
jgi:hypothetical protein